MHVVKDATKARQHFSERVKTVWELGQKKCQELSIGAFYTVWRAEAEFGTILFKLVDFEQKDVEFSNRDDVSPGKGPET